MLKRIRNFLGKMRRFLQFAGMAHQCLLCGRHTRRFTPITRYSGQATIDHYAIIAMGVNPRYRCPWCNSSDKERLVWHYLSQKTDVPTTSRPLVILHVAPERNTRNKLLARENIRYVMGDKFEGVAKYTAEHYGGAQYLDVTDLSEFNDGSFDIVICNHVLEHVLDDRKAMREIRRVLKQDGFAILQVPVSRNITESIEDPSAVTKAQRIEAFGQDDHVRIYAEADYLRRLRDAGFVVTNVAPETLFSSTQEITKYGVNPLEHIYVSRRDASIRV